LRERVSNLLTKVVEDALRISTPTLDEGAGWKAKFSGSLEGIIKVRKMRIILALSGC